MLTDLPNEIKVLKNLHTLYLAGNQISPERKGQLRDLLPKTKFIFGINKPKAKE
jgi:Leucine-rich repeat (LRR) protein